MDLSFIGKGQDAVLTDGSGERSFSQAELQAGKASNVLKPRGGFVAVFK